MCVSRLDPLVLNQTQIHTWWGQGGPALGLFVVSGGRSVRVVLWCFFSPLFLFSLSFLLFHLLWHGFYFGVFWARGERV